MIRTLYHGTTHYNSWNIFENGINLTARGFFLTESFEKAKESGLYIVAFDFLVLPKLGVSTVDKTGNTRDDLDSGIEYVIKNHKQLAEFHINLEDIHVIDYRGRKYA